MEWLSIILAIIGLVFNIFIYEKTKKIDRYVNGYEIIKNCYYRLINVDLNQVNIDKEEFIKNVKYVVIENIQKLNVYDNELAKCLYQMYNFDNKTEKKLILDTFIEIEREFEKRLYNDKMFNIL